MPWRVYPHRPLVPDWARDTVRIGSRPTPEVRASGDLSGARLFIACRCFQTPGDLECHPVSTLVRKRIPVLVSELVRSRFDGLQLQLAGASNKEEVKLAWLRALEGVLDITFDAERGNRDLSYNNVVIEFKGPGKFNGRPTSAPFREALDKRLLPYIQRAAKEAGIDESDYIGIAIDDGHLAFVQVENDAIRHDGLLPITATSFSMVAEACRMCYRRAVTAANLIDDFGPQSSRGRALLGALYSALKPECPAEGSSKGVMFFKEWKALYGQVADLSGEQLASLSSLTLFGDDRPGAGVPEQLFVLHTFNSLVAKLLAAEILAAHGLASGRQFAAEIVAIESDSGLMERLRVDIEESRFFEAMGIDGFVEEVLFGWYLDPELGESCRTSICAGLRAIVAELALYRTDRLGGSRDVLREFYQDLVPDVLRRSLGEFYTPEWLVSFAVDQAGVADWLPVRVIDPTCGSGSFLIEVIERKREEAARVGLTAEETLDKILESVWGFDLNPLAVQASRTNFLIAIADLLREVPGKRIEIPVLLVDAVYSPAELPSSPHGFVEYQVGSEVAELVVLLPAELAFDGQRLDRVLGTMAEFVERNAPYCECSEAMEQRSVLDKACLEDWAGCLRGLYEQVLALHRRGWNGIWFRLVRNFFRASTVGRFDVIVGNPPWVRWSKLPDAYRRRAKPTCVQYDIFSSQPYHGGNELDISGLITYTTADKWLKMGGTMCFVLTQTHFQSPSSEGFRRFRIREGEYLRPRCVVDMQALQPFPGVSNKTSVVVFQKAQTGPEFPVPYRVWRSARGYSRSIPSLLSLEEVLGRVEIDGLEATPVGAQEGGPWAILPPRRFAALRKIVGRSLWFQGRKGITTDLNGVFFVTWDAVGTAGEKIRIQTRPAAGRRDIGRTRRFWVEPTVLYPLLKGAGDFESCYIRPREALLAVVPNEGITKQDYDMAELRMQTKCRRTHEYLRMFEGQLRSRSTWRTRMPNAPFFSIYNVGAYTFAPFKVVWAEQSGAFKAAVATSTAVPTGDVRPYVPDHKIFFVPFEKAEPAFFLCGLLASGVVQQFVESHNISIQVGDIFKHMDLPRFDRRLEDHRRLALVAEEAHREHRAPRRTKIVERVRCLASEVLGIA